MILAKAGLWNIGMIIAYSRMIPTWWHEYCKGEPLKYWHDYCLFKNDTNNMARFLLMQDWVQRDGTILAYSSRSPTWWHDYCLFKPEANMENSPKGACGLGTILANAICKPNLGKLFGMIFANARLRPDLEKLLGTILANARLRPTWKIAHRGPIPWHASC